jgi:predicted O-linked N-acetylglucosamine transferase (SPINDLY family)
MIMGMNNNPISSFLLTSRTAKTQIYWSHGNSVYHVEGIDKRISHFRQNSNIYKFKEFNILPILTQYNTKIEKSKIKQIKAQYPEKSLIIGAIGRLIKFNNDKYLTIIAQILKENPNSIFLACGSGNNTKIKEKINTLGVSERFYFTGYINSHLYAQIIDLYLDPFPLGGGESLQEYRNKGKPYVTLTSKEWYEYIRKYQQSNKLNHILKESLYEKEYLKNMKPQSYLIKENKQANIYSNIPISTNIEEYCSIANRLLKDKELCRKIVEEQIYLMNYEKNNANVAHEFIKAIND